MYNKFIKIWIKFFAIGWIFLYNGNEWVYNNLKW